VLRMSIVVIIDLRHFRESTSHNEGNPYSCCHWFLSWWWN